jgi:adenylate cyclase, class 2
MYEVEQKFPVSDMPALERRLASLGPIGAAQREIDVYFAHPARDFAGTDEALRIRRKGESVSITYKGPKVDATTKTRREVDLPLPPGEPTAAAWVGLLKLLGFVPVAEVRKTRRKAHVPWQDRSVEVSLDEVDQVGQYVELELVVEDDQLDAARASIAALAAELRLEGGERRSYLELLLARRAVERV